MFLFKTSKRTSLLSGFIASVIMISMLFAPALLFAQTDENSFDDFDDLYKDKAEQCAKSAIIQMIIGMIIAQFTSVPVLDGPQSIKELIEDCLIWALKAALIEALTGRTVNWVQTGMDGNPAFVTNVNESLRSVADKAAGAYISSVVPLLCSPFQVDVQLALTELYRQSQRIDYFSRVSCPLSQITDNIEDFTNGNFYAGGWEAWYSVVTNPYSSRIGSIVAGSNEIGIRVSSATGQFTQKINLGSGFLSKETQTCYLTGPDGNPIQFVLDNNQVARGGGESLTYAELVEILAELGFSGGEAQAVVTWNLENGGPFCKSPDTVTPGDTVKTSLELALGRNLDHIVSADEINEIINAAIGFITSNILSGDGGLSGYDPEDFPYTGSSTPGVDPSEDPDLPPVQTSCGTGGWLLSPATEEGTEISFRQNGLVLDASPGNANVAFQIPAEANRVYRRATMSIDVEIGPWYNTVPAGALDGWHQIIFLQRAANPDRFQWRENNIGIINVLGPNNNKLNAGHNMNILIGDCTKAKSTGFSPSQGERYNFTYTYDTVAKTVSTVVRDASGSIVASLSDTPTADKIQSDHPQLDDAGGFFVWVGGPDSHQPPEVPLYGWKFYDLEVTIE